MSYRQKCISEKGEKCALCGNTRGIEVHHIDGNRSNNDLENLMPVCGECHGHIHDSTTDKHEDLHSEWAETETVSFGKEKKELLRKFHDEGPYYTEWADLDEWVDDLLREAINGRYERVSLSEADMKQIHKDGWAVAETQAGEELLIEFEHSGQE